MITSGESFNLALAHSPALGGAFVCTLHVYAGEPQHGEEDLWPAASDAHVGYYGGKRAAAAEGTSIVRSDGERTDVSAWAAEFGGRNGFPPPEKNELVLSIKMGCADTVPWQSKPNTLF